MIPLQVDEEETPSEHQMKGRSYRIGLMDQQWVDRIRCLHLQGVPRIDALARPLLLRCVRGLTDRSVVNLNNARSLTTQ